MSRLVLVMAKKSLTCLLVAACVAILFLSFAADRKYAHIHNAASLLAQVENTNACADCHKPQRRKTSNISRLTKTDTPSPKVPTQLNHTTLYREKLRQAGLESTKLHYFKSPYIIDPIFYDADTIYKVPGKREVKIISCYNCPDFMGDFNLFYARNRDFRNCPYSECYFDTLGQNYTIADLVIFFSIPLEVPYRRPGQLWAQSSLESPLHYSYPSLYPKWKDAFNWTMGYRQDADIFMPYNFFAWRAKERYLSDAEYLKIAKSKPKTAAWFVSNCHSESKRQEYVNRMKEVIDIDIFGRCTEIECEYHECLRRVNSTYKFYLSFENSFCKDYVTEKLFKTFSDRLQVIPVTRGGFDYQRHVPPNMIIDASKFTSPEALAEHLKELANDPPRYTAMLKEKDKLAALNYPNDWCEVCERLHKGVKPKIIKDIGNVTHFSGVCWPPEENM